MATKLPQSKIDEMWAAWQEHQSLYYVARKCKVSYPTVAKYKKLGNWDERIKKVEAKAVRKVDNALVIRRARQLKSLQIATQSYLAQLLGSIIVTCPHCNKQHDIKIPTLKAQFGDIDKIIRLEEFLSGEADSREEHIIEVVYVEPKK